MAPLSRLERLRKMNAADLAKLPDVLPEASPEPEVHLTPEKSPEPEELIEKLEITPKLASTTSKYNTNQQVQAIPAGWESETDSEDGCHIEITPMLDSSPATTATPAAVVETVPATNSLVRKEDYDSDDSSCPSSDEEEDEEAEDGNVQTNAEGATGITKKRGQMSSVGQSFCPVIVISKFPYKYIPKKDSEAVADKFFNAAKFWLRKLDLYYVWHPDGGDRPLVLIPESQFAHLLRDISASFRHLFFNPREAYYRDIGLVIKAFPSHPDFRPRFLGTSSSKQDYDDMVQNTPVANYRPTGEAVPSKPADHRDKKLFRQMIEEAQDLNKAQSKAVKAKKQEERVVRQQNIGKQLKRAQRYLGLRYKREKVAKGLDFPDPTLNIAQRQAAAEAAKEARKVPCIGVHKPVPYEFEGNPVFVCIDVENYELDHNVITEIGVATLDTADLKDLPPGEGGEAWFDQIRHRHFRIDEHKHIRNERFVDGCPDRFEFGESEFIPKKDAAKVVMSCFDDPFSKDSKVSWTSPTVADSKRNIIFVGHAPEGDLAALRILGCKPLDLPNLLETIDTAQLYRIFRREQNPKSVGSILYDFDLTGWHLHNAGNDAAYTMWIMIGTCVRAAAGRGTKEGEEELKARQEKELQEKVQDTIDNYMDEQKAWSSNGEDDGGAPEKKRLPPPRGNEGESQNAPGSWQAKRAERAMAAMKENAASGMVPGRRGSRAGSRAGSRTRSRGSRAGSRTGSHTRSESGRSSVGGVALI